MDNQAAERLRYAIVKQACRDYFAASRRLRRHPLDIVAAETIDECERFFRGDWFMHLCDLDGEWIVRSLRERSKKPGNLKFGDRATEEEEN
ncbi:MAG: hypothetical protein LUI87_02125 [Lachnospiraceae bacterium]|nr:hypothetical protein [Lachnospiraceae bacterium]